MFANIKITREFTVRLLNFPLICFFLDLNYSAVVMCIILFKITFV